IGDEFSWGTIRTSLLASSNRRRWLAVRLGVLGATALVALAALLVLAVILPLAIAAVAGQLPQPPPVDGQALAVLIAGFFVCAIRSVVFAAMTTFTLRSGALTLVIAFVYVLGESIVVGLLARLDAFRFDNAFGDGRPAGPFNWALNIFPGHA